MGLTPTQRWVFIGLILLATKSQNRLKYDLSFLKNTLKVRKIEEHLIAIETTGMIQFVMLDDSTIREDKIREEEKREEIRKEIEKSLSR